MPPLELQKDLVEKLTDQRKVIAKLKAEADKKSKQVKADVEAMILGTKPVPEHCKIWSSQSCEVLERLSDL